MSLLADDTLKLVREARRTQDAPSVPAYAAELVRNAVQEAWFLTEAMRDVLVAARSSTVPRAVEGAHAAAATYRAALDRSKRCLLAYLHHRLTRVVDILWEVGGGSSSAAAALPDQTRRNLSLNETAFVEQYTTLVSDYRAHFLDVDLGASLLPPKDVFIEVRVLKDCGEVVTETGTVRLAKNSQHYLRRSDVERFVTAGYLQQI